MTPITKEEPLGGSPDLTRIAAQLHEGIHEDQRRRAARRRLGVRATVVAGVAAAVALGAVGAISDQAPTAPQPASAQALRRAVAALVPVTGTMLHVVMTGTETAGAGTTDSWTDESWTDYLNPGLPIGFRQIVSGPGGPSAETASFSVNHIHQTQLYDPSNNTIYTGAPPLPAPAGGWGATHVVTKGSPATLPAHALGCGAGLGPMPVPASTTDEGAQIIADVPYLGSGSIESLQSLITPSPPMPWSEIAAAELQSDLQYGCATVVGYPTVDGHATVEVTGANGQWTYYADASTDEPVQIDFTGTNRTWMSLEFTTYEQIPVQGNSDLLNLAAQHPSATVDTSTSDYLAAQTRLFPAGSSFATGNGTLVKGPPA